MADGFGNLAPCIACPGLSGMHFLLCLLMHMMLWGLVHGAAAHDKCSDDSAGTCNLSYDLLCSYDLDGGMFWLCWKADVFSSFIR